MVRVLYFKGRGAWVPSLVRELRICMPFGSAKKKKNLPELKAERFQRRISDSFLEHA